jgi:hypothetical protein
LRRARQGEINAAFTDRLSKNGPTDHGRRSLTTIRGSLKSSVDSVNGLQRIVVTTAAGPLKSHIDPLISHTPADTLLNKKSTSASSNDRILSGVGLKSLTHAVERQYFERVKESFHAASPINLIGKTLVLYNVCQGLRLQRAAHQVEHKMGGANFLSALTCIHRIFLIGQR